MFVLPLHRRCRLAAAMKVAHDICRINRLRGRRDYKRPLAPEAYEKEGMIIIEQIIWAFIMSRVIEQIEVRL